MLKNICVLILIFTVSPLLKSNEFTLSDKTKNITWKVKPILNTAYLEFSDKKALKKFKSTRAKAYKKLGCKFHKINSTSIIAILPKGKLAQFDKEEFGLVYALYLAEDPQSKTQTFFAVWKSCVVMPKPIFAKDFNVVWRTIHKTIMDAGGLEEYEVLPRIVRDVKTSEISNVVYDVRSHVKEHKYPLYSKTNKLLLLMVELEKKEAIKSCELNFFKVNHPKLFKALK